MIKPGLEAFLDARECRGPIGVVTNDTARDADGRHLIDRLISHPGVEVKAIFTPEHGFGSDAPDGEAVGSSRHPRFGCPIHSLYGPRKAPEPAELAGIDALVYDIQDVGVRFYTYISTLRNCLEAAARQQIPFHVLDRPDLLGGLDVEGPALERGFESFVGHLPVPLRYGLTPGELAHWWNRRLSPAAPLTVWQVAGWRRGMAFADGGFPWTRPSPSMVSPATAAFYPGTCLFEGTNLSEGRGTKAPFQIIGAPFTDPEKWAAELRPQLPPEIDLAPVTFRPTFSKFAGEECRGLHFTSRTPLVTNAVGLAVRMLIAFRRSHTNRLTFPGRATLPHPFFDHLAGNAWLRQAIERDQPTSEIDARCTEETKPFRQDRKGLLLYS